MKYCLLTGIFFISVLISSCDKPCYGFKCKCVSGMELPCYNSSSDLYFDAKIDGVEFCLKDGENNYRYKTNIYNISVTEPGNPDFNTSNITTKRGIIFSISDISLSEYSFQARLKGPAIDSKLFSLVEQLDKLESEEYLIPRSDQRSDEGYAFTITYACVSDKENKLNTEIYYIPLTHAHRAIKQPPESYILVSEYVKQDLGDAWLYDITFEMTLRLFYYEDKWRVFGDLEHATFKTRTVVPK